MKSPSITIIDPSFLFRRGLETVLKGVEYENVESYQDIDEYFKNKTGQPTDDIMFMNLSVDSSGHSISMSGRESLFKIRENSFSGRLIIMLDQLDDQIITELIQRRIDGIMVKRFAQEEDIITAIKRVNGGSNYYSPEITEVLANIISHGNYKTPHITNEFLSQLTNREKEVLLLIGEGLKNEEIAKRLYVDPRTISTHKQNIKNKLELDDSNDLIRYIMINIGSIRSILGSFH
ncbi:response regulator transcription factor [Spirosoma validum]|uniref:Response regulator transcription factor n=1 Tax=Spirosoma validum TaxID=2771355 RepID=A0A927GDI2_9BACT|nr:response regulator transcription factor [Spirosoma validum]MBD2753744.1 response regulator transcription factor [Spirosoma validum]